MTLPKGCKHPYPALCCLQLCLQLSSSTSLSRQLCGSSELLIGRRVPVTTTHPAAVQAKTHGTKLLLHIEQPRHRHHHIPVGDLSALQTCLHAMHAAVTSQVTLTEVSQPTRAHHGHTHLDLMRAAFSCVKHCSSTPSSLSCSGKTLCS